VSAAVVGLYFAAWAGLHTALASLKVKAWVARALGPGAPRYYRLGYVLFAGVSLAPLAGLLLVLPDHLLYAVPDPWRWFMVAGQLGALILLAWTLLLTDASEFLGLRLAFGRGRPRQPRLITRGPYRYTRHPMYLSGLVLMWLMPVMSVNLLALFGAASLYLFLGSLHEERLLGLQFGDDYRQYSRRVPRIFPGRRRPG
jgi:protein-S-isoprenylcysteine O-methyltransferase Ste14